jgi:hypothetical protein
MSYLQNRNTEQKKKPKKSTEGMAISTMNLKKQGDSTVNNNKGKT